MIGIVVGFILSNALFIVFSIQKRWKPLIVFTTSLEFCIVFAIGLFVFSKAVVFNKTGLVDIFIPLFIGFFIAYALLQLLQFLINKVRNVVFSKK